MLFQITVKHFFKKMQVCTETSGFVKFTIIYFSHMTAEEHFIITICQVLGNSTKSLFMKSSAHVAHNDSTLGLCEHDLF